MPRIHFIRQTAAVLMVCSLIAGLLPGFVAAQDQPARERLRRSPLFKGP